jgi:hypothetical protein
MELLSVPLHPTRMQHPAWMHGAGVRALILATGVASLLGTAGCGGHGTPVQPTSPTPTSLPIQTAPSTLFPTATATLVPLRNHDLTARIGIAAVDAVLDAIAAGTADALAPLLQYMSVPCVAQPPNQGSRHPYLCPEGKQPGDPLTGFPVYDVEGGLAPAEGLAEEINRALSRRLYGVFRYPQPQTDVETAREYAIVFLDVSAFFYRFVTVDVRDGRIVSMDYHPDFELMYRPDDPEWVLPPVALPPRPPAGP